MKELKQASTPRPSRGEVKLLTREEAEALTPRRQRSQVEIEQSLDQLSRWMDGLFRIPGTGWRFGLDAIVGLIPGVGDTVSTLTGFYILAAGVRYRVSKVTLLRMGLNIGVDYVFGAIPLVGDLFDAAWKSNQKNVELLRERATVNAQDARRGRLSDWLFVGFIMLALLALLVGSITILWFLWRFLYDQLSRLF